MSAEMIGGGCRSELEARIARPDLFAAADDAAEAALTARPLMSAPIVLPDGVEHGTPEGNRAGCKPESACPALYTHGMACTTAAVREMTDVRYYKAKRRNPDPAAIAAYLGIRPVDQEAEAAARRERSQRARATLAANRATTEPTTPEEATMPTPPTPEPSARKGHTPPPALSADMTAEDRAACREWAAANGHPAPTKGRIPNATVRAFLQAMTDAPAGSAAKLEQILTDESHQSDDFGTRSDMLDETRSRIVYPSPAADAVELAAAVAAVAAGINAPITAAPTELKPVRPEWADVAISEDVERAEQRAERAITFATHAEAENALLLQQITTLSNALATALHAWDSALARAESSERAVAHATVERRLAESARSIVGDRLTIAGGRIGRLREELADALALAETRNAHIRLLKAELEDFRTPWYRRRSKGANHADRSL